MPEIARYIGGAGTGKTAELMRTLELVLARDIDAMQVGFVSFTRAARREASSRAASITGYAAEQLEADGWFRTLHSVCFRALGAKRENVLAGDRKSAAWVGDRLGEDVGIALGADLGDEGGDFEARTDAGIALQLWSTARNRLVPLSVVWDTASRCSRRTPDYAATLSIVERYEQAKRLDGARDFTDLLGEFAGWQFGVDGHERTRPLGDSPTLHVWFFDEQQDTSPLLDSVCQRLIESAVWVYVVGDPMQAIYGWAGADGTLFRRWPAAKERIMPKSYRCAAPIHAFGESLLRQASDYWDRGILPADHAGRVDVERLSRQLLSEIRADESWLVLARTNWLANTLASRLTEANVPWRATKGPGGWPRQSRVKCLLTLARLAIGESTSAAEWRDVVKILPTKLGDEVLLARGVKSQWEADFESRKNQRVSLADLEAAGGTDVLARRIASPSMPSLVDGGEDAMTAFSRWGEQAITTPTVRVGTIHSAKGAEADNVLWLTTATDAVSRTAEDPLGHNEECRVAYVAATRARRRLVVAVEPNQRHRFRLPT